MLDRFLDSYQATIWAELQNNPSDFCRVGREGADVGRRLRTLGTGIAVPQEAGSAAGTSLRPLLVLRVSWMHIQGWELGEAM